MTAEPRSGLVAVLFTDLVGSTELMSKLGERPFDELRRQHFSSLSKAVAAHGGEEIKNTGDGILAVFPSAAEAVEAAVAMQQGPARRRGDVQLSMRVGVAVGDATLEDGDVFGAPVVEAARLVGAAQPGQILATAVVRMLAGSRSTAGFTDLGSLELKGLPEPVAVCEVGWEQVTPSTIPMPALLTDVGRIFVGRDDEVERLSQLWKEGAAGERRVALLAGEPGVGKTRLAAQLAATVHGEGANVLAGRCDEDLGVPYQPFVEALRHFVDHTPADDLGHRLGRYGGELQRLVPELTQSVSDLPPPLKSDPETERYRLFDAVSTWLTAASADEPMLVVLDDLQWAAKPTLLLLRHVVRSAQSMRILVLGTYRDTELGHDHPLVELLADLRRQGGVDRLSLTGLDSSGVATYMERAAGHDLDQEDLALARAIHDETEGNPFFVREVLRHLVESGALERRAGRWGARLPVEELGVPESVREVVGRRIARLSPEANDTLRIAAVAGPEFEVRVVQVAGDLEEGTLLTTVENATEAHLIIEAGTHRFRFAHALVRDTLYHDLSATRRTTLHRRVAEAIERVHAARLDDHLPALAHHWARASLPAAETAKAVDYATRAGDRALTQLANDEAVNYYRQALHLVDAGSGSSDGDDQRLELLIAMGEAQRRAGDPGHRETLLQAARLGQDLSDPDSCARAALANRRGPYSRWEGVDRERVAILEQALEAIGPAETHVRARLLASLACELYFANDDRRCALGDQALVIARRLGDPAVLAEVLDAAWYATWDPAGLAQRRASLDELAELARRLGDEPLEFRAGIGVFLTAMQQTDVERADAGLETCARIAEDLGQPLLRWQLLYTQAHRAMVAGRLEDAGHLIDEARQLGEAAGQPVAVVYQRAGLVVLSFLRADFEEAVPVVEPFASTIMPFRAAMAWTYAEIGRFPEARALVEGLRGGAFTGIPRDHAWLSVLVLLARACTRLGEPEAAAELYELLLPHAAETASTPAAWFGPVAHDLGLLATVVRRYEDANSHFAEAARIEARLGASAMLLHTRLEWARMLLTRRTPGDREQARELLGQALTSARELRLGNVEQGAAALLEQA